MFNIVMIALLLVNLAAFLVMGIDKRRARKNEWRIPEKVLFLFALCFGGFGGTAGMFFFHHKTKHWYFRLFFPLMMVIQAVALVWLLPRLA